MEHSTLEGAEIIVIVPFQAILKSKNKVANALSVYIKETHAEFKKYQM